MAYATLEFNNFQDIDHALGVRRSLPLAPNTVAYRTGVNESEIAISYHGNDIAIWDTGTKAITLQTGGWDTPTTVDRLHQIARGNDLGSVGIVGGVARFTHTTRDHGWYSMKDRVTIDRDGNVEHNDPDRKDGTSNWQTREAWLMVQDTEPRWKYAKNCSRRDLREMIKDMRSEIGYDRIENVNVTEIFYGLRNED